MATRDDVARAALDVGAGRGLEEVSMPAVAKPPPSLVDVLLHGFASRLVAER